MPDKIIDVIANERMVERELIVPTVTLQTLGLGSMNVVMILMGLEEAFNVYMPMNADFSNARNLAELVGAALRTMQRTTWDRAAQILNFVSLKLS